MECRLSTSVFIFQVILFLMNHPKGERRQSQIDRGSQRKCLRHLVRGVVVVATRSGC